jgi:hypothetical protein
VLVADARRQFRTVIDADVRRAAPLIEALVRRRGSRPPQPYRAPGSTLPSPQYGSGAWQLVVRRDGEVVSRKELQASVTKIGRTPGCHVALDDPGVSRMHAVIERRDDELTIIDLGSVEGTLVDGKKVSKAHLEQGDRVTIGPFELELTRSTVVRELADTHPAEMPPAEPTHRCAACGASNFAALVDTPPGVVPAGYRGEYCERCGKVDLFKILA